MSQLPKGQSPEVNSDGRELNLPGTYVHSVTGAKFITSDGNEGVSQADALKAPVWKDQWERVGEVPSRVEILALNKEQQIKDAATDALQKGKDDAELKEATKKAVEAAKVAV